jgi:membrane-associated phospholipid phosphatase
VILLPLLFLLLVSVVAGAFGAYVISRDPFRALATGGTPGFAAAVASRAAARRGTIRGWIDACRHRTTVASLAFCASLAVLVTIAIAVASSRVFLDVHWVSDVVAGLALSWAWFAFCAIAFGGRPRRLRRREEAPVVSSLAGT